MLMFPIVYFPTRQLNPVEIFPIPESTPLGKSEKQGNTRNDIRSEIWKILESQPSSSTRPEEIVFQQKALRHLNQ